MKNIARNLNVILATSLIFAIILTWIGPIVIRLLFTPPVSFGTNCEPAAAWALSKLIWTQLIGIVVGALLSALFLATRSKSQKVEKTSP